MPVAVWLDEPIKGNCPILILSGEYDANTPIRMGDQIQKTFPKNSRHLILPYQGHAAADYECRFNLITQFVDTKSLYSIDTSCLMTIQPKSFLFEIDLTDTEFQKYEGIYSNEDPNKILRLFRQNGSFYLMDEFSQWSGPSQLLFKGNHTFV